MARSKGGEQRVLSALVTDLGALRGLGKAVRVLRAPQQRSQGCGRKAQMGRSSTTRTTVMQR
jgi:hypothetical protein